MSDEHKHDDGRFDYCSAGRQPTVQPVLDETVETTQQDVVALFERLAEQNFGTFSSDWTSSDYAEAIVVIQEFFNRMQGINERRLASDAVRGDAGASATEGESQQATSDPDA